MNKITIPKSMIERIKQEVISEILISKNIKLDSKKDLKLSPIDHGVIADSVLAKIKRPVDGINGEAGKDLIYTDQIRNDIVESLLPRIPEPLDGSNGEKGRKGDRGEKGSNYILTEKDKLDVADITKTVTQKSVNNLLNKIIADIKSGKIGRKQSGIGPKDAIDLINKGLGGTDWQSGGGTDPITTRGDVIRGDASGDSERLALGTNGQVLGSDGTDLVYISIPGGGDMLKSTYDTGDSGIVDDSEGLDGNDSAYHLARANHTGTQTASTISDFDAEVANETNVTANTAHRSSDGKNHSDVVLNNTHRGSAGTDHSDVGLNNTHRASDGKNHSDVVTNNAKVTNATHSGEVTGDTALTIANNAVTTVKILDANVTLAKLANIATARILGRDTAGSGVPEELTAAEARTLINVEDGADVTDATNVNSAGAVMEADYDANTVLAATSDNAPAALTVPAQTLVGRITAGNIDALTIAEIVTLLFHTGTTAPTDTTRFWIDTN